MAIKLPHTSMTPDRYLVTTSFEAAMSVPSASIMRALDHSRSVELGDAIGMELGYLADGEPCGEDDEPAIVITVSRMVAR